jgi:uncharacterized BrkB/YihY/UPF0761 family membrane protein
MAMPDRRTSFMVILAWSLLGLAFVFAGTSPGTPLTLEEAVRGGAIAAAIWILGTLVFVVIWAATQRLRAARRR